ncbi:MAG: DUF192 domain-containing protein [Chloroflexota bacterium]
MPRYVKIANLNRTIDALEARYCSSFLCQLRGLTFRRRIARDEGLLLVQRHDSRLEASIHMLFCFTDLAIIWLDSSLKVVDKVLAKAWRPAYFPARPAKYILETQPERLGDFEAGDQIELENA